MSPAVQLAPGEFDRLRAYVERECGVVLEGKAYLIETRLSRLLMETAARSYDELLRRVERDATGRIKDKLIDAITTHETSWFRDGSPWTGLKHHVVPDVLDRANEERRKARFWSAACSTGQEPYTLAMVALERAKGMIPTAPDPGSRFEILATDISGPAVMLGRMGRYDAIAMNRGFDGEWRGYRERYFKQMGRACVVDDVLKKQVLFQRTNLLENTAGFGRFDVILLRNVAIYFSAEAKKALFDRMAMQLTPDGYLFLGSGETTNGYSDRFRLDNGPGYTCFRRR